MKFEKQTYTQTPNSLFVEMKDMDECELKVVLLICRYTFGYHRDEVKLSTRRIADEIGMNTASVSKGAERAIERGLIEKVIDGNKTTLWRALVSDSEIESRAIQKLNRGDSEIESLSRVKESIKKENKIGDKSPLSDMPLDWQLSHGKEINRKDQTDAQAKDAANLIDMGAAGAGSLAYAFMSARGIIFTEAQVKAQRKAARELLANGVTASDVRQAVKELTDKKMTVTDLFSITKTAINIAHPIQTEDRNPQGLEVGL